VNFKTLLFDHFFLQSLQATFCRLVDLNDISTDIRSELYT